MKTLKEIKVVHVYLMLIGIALGMSLILSFVVAPVIFGFEKTILNHYDAGLFMSEIFRRFGYILNTIITAILIYEAYRYKQLERDTLIFISAFVAIFTGYMFTLFYTPAILELQAQGAGILEDPQFQGLHKGSVIDMSLLILSLTVLFILRANYDRNKRS